MPSLGFTLTRDEITPALTKVASSALHDQLAISAAMALAGIAQRAFDEPGLRPAAWAPRKSGGGHPLLLLSGTLRQSIHAAGLGNGAAEIRMPPVYAATQQLGSAKASGRGSGVPARPFFPALNDQLTGQAVQAIDDVMSILIRGAAGQ